MPYLSIIIKIDLTLMFSINCSFEVVVFTLESSKWRT